jgi:cell division protease FtsH
MTRLSRILCAAAIVAAAMSSSCSSLDEKAGPERVPYSTFEKYLDSGQIKEASVGSNDIEATLRDGKTIVTARVPPDIAAALASHGVQFSGKQGLDEGGSLNWLAWLFPVMMLLPILLLMRGGVGGAAAGTAAAMTKSKARVFAETDTKTSFADVAGVDEAKEELHEIVAFL